MNSLSNYTADRRIKILFTIPNFITAGSGQAMLNIVRGLNPNIYAPAVCVEKKGGALDHEVEKLGIPFLEEKFTVPARPYSTLLFRAHSRAQAFKPYQFNLWHSFHYSDDYTEPVISKMAGAEHWLYTKKNMSWGSNAWKLRTFFASKIAAQNTDMLKTFFYSSRDRKKSKLISTSVDTAFFNAGLQRENIFSKVKNFQSQDIKVGCVAHLSRVKGIDLLIRAMKNTEHTVLYLAGRTADAQYEQELRALAVSCGIANRVIFKGDLRDVREMLSDLDIFVLPSHGEGCPVALLEAMAMGLACITTQTPGCRDVIQDKVTGLLVPADNVENISEAIVELAKSKSKREILGARAREHIETHYGLETEVRKYELLYESLTKKNRTRIVLAANDPPETFLYQQFMETTKRFSAARFYCFNPINSKSRRKLREDRYARIRNKMVFAPGVERLLLPLFFISNLTKAVVLNPLGLLHYMQQLPNEFGFIKKIKCLYLDSKLIAIRPQILHFEYGALAVGKMYLGRCLGAEILVSFRGYDINYVGLEQQNYYEEVWTTADAVHFLGEDLKKRAVKRGFNERSFFRLISPAIDLECFAPRMAEKKEPVRRAIRLISVGRLVWKKGYEYTVKAIKKLTEQGFDVHLDIIGDGEFFEALAFTVDQENLNDRISLKGNVDPEQLKKNLEEADIFIHAAVSEGFCNAVIEAQAMGLPVITSDADGLAENIEDGVTGFVVPRRNISMIAEKTAKLIKNPKMRMQMGAAGRKRAERLFNLKNQSAAFANLYSEMLTKDKL